MDLDNKPTNRSRETLLSVGLIVVLGGAMAFFLNLVSMGILFHVLAAVLAITIVGFVHYAVWGYAMSQEVAAEREELERREQIETEADEYSDKVRDITRYRRL
jgi:hypothetical protein